MSAVAHPIDDLLAAARTALDMDLVFLSHVDEQHQVVDAVDAGPGALQLPVGGRLPIADTLCSAMLSGAMPPVVPDLAADPVASRLPVVEWGGLGAYCGVPVHLPDGTLYGTLCGLDSRARPDLSRAQLTVLGLLAGMLSHQLQERQRERSEAADRRGALLQLLEPGGLSIVVQPIVDLVDEGVPGVEALSRFRRADGGDPRPDRVFAEAAASGAGRRFELAALAAALEVLPRLPPATYLAVNLSASTLADPRTAAALAAAPLDRLVLELTEHDAVEDYDAIAGVLGELRPCGLRLAVDDVGAGFAGLRHILRLSPDVLKLDISLVRGVEVDPARRALVAAFVGFAQQLGVSLVAEGVETAAQRDALLELGVRLAQGFLLGRPAPHP